MLQSVRFAVLAAAASLMAAPALAQSSPVVGTWATAVDLQGTKLYTVDIKDGAMPGAPADAPPPASTISDVVVDGSKLTFKRAITLEQGPMNLSYTTTVDGDTLTGEIVSDFGPIAVTGTRK
jgi:hypothetical protein